MTNTEIKPQNPDSEPVEENYDPHRFTAEPKKKKVKQCLSSLAAF